MMSDKPAMAERMRYVQPTRIPRDEALAILESGDTAEKCQALVDIAFHESDWRFAQDLFLKHLAGPDWELVRLSAVCLGHVARVHGTIDHDRVIAALSGVRGRRGSIDDAVDNALSDIAMFAPRA